MKISNKISLSFLAIVIIISATIFPVFYLVVKNSLEQKIGEKLNSLSYSRTNHIETYLRMLEISVGQLSKSVSLESLLKVAGKDNLRQSNDFKAAIRRLKRTKASNVSVYEFLLMNTRGKVVASTEESSIGQDKATDSIFIGAQKEIHIKDAYYSKELKEPLIAVSAPFFDNYSGELLGVLAARVKLDDLYGITTESVGLGKTEEVYIVNKYGFMITPSRFLKDTFLKQKVDTENLRRGRLHKGKKHIISEEKIVDVYSNYRGTLVLGTHEYIPQMQWVVLAEIGVKEAFAPLAAIRSAFAAILFGMIIFAWLLGLFVSRAITAPLGRLHKGAEIIGTGNLDHKVGTNVKDEVGQLSRAFDTMTENLRIKTTSVENLNKEIAERKRLEEQLKRKTELLEAQNEASIDGVLVVDENRQRILTNKRLLELWEVPKHIADDKNDEVLLQYVVSRIKNPEQFLDKVRYLYAHKDETSKDDMEFKNGKVFERYSSPIIDKNGKNFGRIWVFHDITERKRAQEQIQLAAQEWERTFNSIADFVFVQDKDFRILKANKAFLDAIKHGVNDVIGKKCYEILHKSDKPWPNCPFGKTITDNTPHSEEVDDQCIGIPLLVTVSPIFNNKGELIGSVHIAKDISEIKKTREELEKKNIELDKSNQIKSSFTSMVSHELRSPLAIIKESVGIVFEGLVGDVNDEQKDLLDTAKKNVDRLGRLINNVLDFQKMESGRMEYDIQENDINAVALEVHKAMGFLIVEKGLDFVLNLQENIPNVRFDKDKIIQVFTNLVSNAIKFTEKGSVSITTKKEDNTVHVIVQDTGVGIKSEDMEKLFQPFEQLSGARDKKKGGTGLGLSICKRIILAQNGKIWAESEAGKGSVFHFVLPIEEHRG